MTDTAQRQVNFVANPTAATSHEIQSRGVVYNLIRFGVLATSLAAVGGLAIVNSLFAAWVGAGAIKLVLLICGLIAAVAAPGISVAWPYVIKRRPELWWPGTIIWGASVALSAAAMTHLIYTLNSPDAPRLPSLPTLTVEARAGHCTVGIMDIGCVQQSPCWYDRECLDRLGYEANDIYRSNQGRRVEDQIQRNVNIVDARFHSLKKHPESAPTAAAAKPNQPEASHAEAGWQGGSLVFSALAGLIIILVASFLPQFGGEALLAFSQDGNPMPGMTTFTPPSAVTPVAPEQLDDIDQAFLLWKERLLWDAALTTRAQELYNDFRGYCRSIGKPCWMTKDGSTPPRFGQAMEPLLRAKKATTDLSNGTIYRGVGLPTSKSGA